MMLGWLIPLLLLAGIAWLVLRRPAGGAEDPAERVLRERYARGELDEETYRRMLAELRRR